MKKVTINSAFIKDIPVDVSCFDSNEVPEDECSNRMVIFKAGEKEFQYMNIEPETAFNKFSTSLKIYINNGGMRPPEIVYCLIVKFKESYDIDWKTIERNYNMRKDIAQA